MTGCLAPAALRRLLLLLFLLLTAGEAAGQLLAVIDKSRPEDAGLSQAQLNTLAQAARGEARRRLPSSVQVLSEENTVTILRDMGVELADCQGDCEVEIARNLQADWLLSLQLVRFGTVWNLQLNLFETATGALRGSERATAERQDRLVDAAEAATGRLALVVGARDTPGARGVFGAAGEAWELPELVGVLVTFESTPPGATVTLDGSYLGETPLTRELSPGPRSLRFSLPRYEDREERLTVDMATTIARELTPLFGWLTVESTPAGQPVWLDGVPAGITPLTDHLLGHGAHTVLVGDSARTYPVGEHFTLAKGERRSLRYTVALREGGLLVRCADEDGNALALPVRVNGEPRGESPLQLKLPVGEHLVEAGGQRRTVRLTERQVEELNLQVAAPAPATTPSGGFDGPLPGMRFVALPGGTFTMGSPASEAGRYADEVPHQVTLSPFAIMTTEVTQAQWQAVMGTNPSIYKGADRPVESVSWHDVQEFIRQLNRRDPGHDYRLPTEAEWEYACRAGSTGRWCFGDDEGRLGEYAWYAANAGGETRKVALKRPNAWGLYDMHGNVWEWCSDWYGPYGSSVRDPQGPGSGSYRVLRGGYWYSSAAALRCARRYSVTPSSAYNYIGFRLCRTLP
jgi:formylglycine-generating enzyme required for sulfatase activity